MIELERHIEILLLDNDCVIVPEFGGFMAQHTNARYSEVDNTFLPPIRTIGFNPQLNLITDRIMLPQMNNCNAGCENITLAPNGQFYICPAFYYSEDDKQIFQIGNLKDGLNIRAAQLYKLSHAPLCRTCDAYQCKRCVWLNRKTTFDVTTPSHEQCVMAHIERNASRDLLIDFRKQGEIYPEQEIKEIDYLDPFDVRIEWNKVKKHE